MLSVQLPYSQLTDHLNEQLSVAAINSTNTCVVSGTLSEIDRFERMLTDRGVESHRLHINVAAHSPMLEPFMDEFNTFMQSVPLSPPAIPFVSNVTGRWISDEEACDPSYWCKHLRNPVRFADGLATICSNAPNIMLEVGPGSTLNSLAAAATLDKASLRLFSSSSLRARLMREHSSLGRWQSYGQWVSKSTGLQCSTQKAAGRYVFRGIHSSEASFGSALIGRALRNQSTPKPHGAKIPQVGSTCQCGIPYRNNSPRERHFAQSAA